MKQKLWPSDQDHTDESASWALVSRRHKEIIYDKVAYILPKLGATKIPL